MAKVNNGLYIPEPKDIRIVDGSAVYLPDSNVSGRRFEPDGNGGGILYIRRRRMVPGFRKPKEEWIQVKKLPRTN
jgi:hypothetical protein